jgi:hypothetical protein
MGPRAIPASAGHAPPRARLSLADRRAERRADTLAAFASALLPGSSAAGLGDPRSYPRDGEEHCGGARSRARPAGSVSAGLRVPTSDLRLASPGPRNAPGGYSASSLLRIFSVAWAALTRATYSTTSGGASSSASQTTTWTWVWLIISQRARLAGVNVALG